MSEALASLGTLDVVDEPASGDTDDYAASDYDAPVEEIDAAEVAALEPIPTVTQEFEPNPSPRLRTVFFWGGIGVAAAGGGRCGPRRPVGRSVEVGGWQS